MGAHSLAEAIARHAEEDGVVDTPIEGLTLFRSSQPAARQPGVYSTGICVIAQGMKQAYIGGEPLRYDPDNYLCCSLPLPAEAELVEASPERPALGLLLDLGRALVSKTLIELDAATEWSESVQEVAPGFAVATVDERFADAVYRLVELLDDHEALGVLVESRMREVVFAVLRGEAGASVRRSLSASNGISRAIAYLDSNLHDSISVADLAKRAGMSRAVFHRRFKETTNHSPIQFIKSLRLNRAALELSNGATVTEAALAVGYASVPQFSREFSRLFGAPPKQWVRNTEASQG